MTRCTVTGNEPVNEPSASVPNPAKRPDGQHVDHWTMCPGEIIKAGFVRPVRDSYVHRGIVGPTNPLRDLTTEEMVCYTGAGYVKFEDYHPGTKVGFEPRTAGRFWTQVELDKIDKGCGVKTRMPMSCAETYAANPKYYGSTFCCGCSSYLPVAEFVWYGTNDRVGS